MSTKLSKEYIATFEMLKVSDEKRAYALLYEWVKTGKVSKSVFMKCVKGE